MWPGLPASSAGPPRSPKFLARGIDRSLLEVSTHTQEPPLSLVRGMGGTEEASSCQAFPF